LIAAGPKPSVRARCPRQRPLFCRLPQCLGQSARAAGQNQIARQIDLGQRSARDPAIGQADRALLHRPIAQDLRTGQTQRGQQDRHGQAPAIG